MEKKIFKSNVTLDGSTQKSTFSHTHIHTYTDQIKLQFVPREEQTVEEKKRQREEKYDREQGNDDKKEAKNKNEHAFDLANEKYIIH